MICRRIGNLIRTLWLRCRGLQCVSGSRVFHGVEITHPSRVQLGINAVLYQHCSILTGKIGGFTLGRHSHLSSYVYLLIQDNKISIGDNVAVGPFTAMFCHSHGVQNATDLFSQSYVDEDIEIGSNVFIGSHCVILPGTVMEDKVVLAANSVASGRLQSGYLYGGSPARQIKAL